MNDTPPKPRPPASAPEVARHSNAFAWSKVKREPYYVQPLNVDLGVRATTAAEALTLLDAEVDVVRAQLAALAAIEDRR